MEYKERRPQHIQDQHLAMMKQYLALNDLVGVAAQTGKQRTAREIVQYREAAMKLIVQTMIDDERTNDRASAGHTKSTLAIQRSSESNVA